MKASSLTVCLLLVLGTLILAGCREDEEPSSEPAVTPSTVLIATARVEPSSTPSPVATLSSTATLAPTHTPTTTRSPSSLSTPVPASTPAPVAGRAELTLTMYDLLAGGVVSEAIPATTYMGGPDVIPEHVQYQFEGYALTDTFHKPRLYVYSVSEFVSGSDVGAGVINDLEQFLAERPATPASIPFLPIWTAGQMIRTQLEYVSFQNGEGVRFLTQYGQAAWPINNRDLFYTFQGITDDGETYVAAVLPVSHPTLPDVAPEDLDEAFYENYRGYIRAVEQELSARKASTFTPDLSLVDGMIHSIEVVRSVP